MRWLTFFLLAAAVLTLQSTVAPRLEVLGARPDWLLVVVVFFSLYAPRREAVISAWIVGMAADLMTVERLGLLALSYALVAAGITSVREHFFRYRAATQFVVTLAACLLVQAAWLAYRRALYDTAEPFLADLTVDVVTAAIYTAVWAVLLHKGLLRMSGMLGLARPRYSYAGLHRLGDARV